MYIVTEAMKKAGTDIAKNLKDAEIASSMGKLSGIDEWEAWTKNYDGKNMDLIRQYLDNKIDSLTAIYTAMHRESKEQN